MISQAVFYTALLAAVLWTFTNPVVGLATYYVLALARPQDVYWWWGAERLSFLVGGAVCAMWLAGWFRGSHNGPGKSRITILLVTLILFQLASALFAANQAAAWDYMEKVTKMALFFFVTVSLVRTRQQFRVMVLITAASLAYLGWWGNWTWYVEGVAGGTTGELAGPGWEIGATLTDRNLFAYMLATGIPFCFFVFFIERASRFRWLALAPLPLLANAVMLTFSRGGMLALVVGGFWSVLRLKRPRVMLAFGLVGGLMVSVLAGREVMARFDTIWEYDEDRSATGRLESWKAGFMMIADHPLLGVGPANYGLYSSVYNPKVTRGLLAHNTFIELTAEDGIPAGIIFVSIIALACRSLHRIQRRTWPAAQMHWAYYSAAMLQSALLSYVVGAFFVSLPFFELFYLLIALTVCLERTVASRMSPTHAPRAPSLAPAQS